MRLVASGRNVDSDVMSTHKPKSHETSSYTLVIVASFVIAVLMPFVRAVATGETVAAAYATVAPAPVTATATLAAGRGSDELSLLVVGVFLLGLGSVLRRVA
jgi:hypothetical protein